MQNIEFEIEFERELHGRFRLRWSDKRHEYHVEQRLGPSNPHIPPPIYRTPEGTDSYDTFSDEWIRARDGYMFTMAIRPGTKMPCPVCGADVDVPQMVTAESHCPMCRKMGRDGRYVAAYYPLNHVLIEHVRSLDPYTDGPKRSRERLRQNQLTKYARDQRQALDDAEAMVRFNNNQVMNNPMSGYGAKTPQRDDGSRLEPDRFLG